MNEAEGLGLGLGWLGLRQSAQAASLGPKNFTNKPKVQTQVTKRRKRTKLGVSSVDVRLTLRPTSNTRMGLE